MYKITYHYLAYTRKNFAGTKLSECSLKQPTPSTECLEELCLFLINNIFNLEIKPNVVDISDQNLIEFWQFRVI